MFVSHSINVREGADLDTMDEIISISNIFKTLVN